VTKLFRPCNGTTGASFIEAWCGNCKRDVAFRNDEGDSCPIVAASLAFDIDHPEYPKEWTYGDDGSPICTAFEPIDAPDRQDPNASIRDLFAGKP
jgi:hypothetical protein